MRKAMSKEKLSDFACPSCHSLIDLTRASAVMEGVRRRNLKHRKAGAMTLSELAEALNCLHPLTELRFEDGSYVADVLNASGGGEIKPVLGASEFAVFPNLVINEIAEHLAGEKNIQGSDGRVRYVHADTPVWRGERLKYTTTAISDVTEDGVLLCVNL